MAQLDVHPTGNQEVASSFPAGLGNFFFMLIDHEKCLRSFSPFPLFKKGSCQFLAKECTLILVNSLEDKACP